MKKTFVLLSLCASVVMAQIACDQTPKFANKSAEEGYHLAQRYCTSCHLLPQPEELNKTTWLQYVLPKMGSLLGFTNLGSGRYFVQNKAAMPLDDWNKIVLYYFLQSPKELPASSRKPAKLNLTHFSVDTAFYATASPATTMVAAGTGKQVWFADGVARRVFLINDRQLADSFKAEEGVCNLQLRNGAYWVLSMGLLHPSNERLGKLVQVDTASKRQTILLDSLQRPVDVAYADLDNDGREDIVVCEFGNTEGALSWYKNAGDHFVRKVLRPLPGAISVKVTDLNRDGLPDVIALMAQGDESVFAYYNEGKGSFREERLLRFPPSYGSNSMQVADFNNDGFLDIMTTNGDNGDYPPILKPYHGVRIFLNDGKNHFSQEGFLPVNGIGKAIAADFDGDGDLDIATIAYFADFDNTPAESFIYWQNTGALSFEPRTFKAAASGRWLVMTAGDVDGDGRADFVLGNANFSLGNVPNQLRARWNESSPSVLLLRNRH